MADVESDMRPAARHYPKLILTAVMSLSCACATGRQPEAANPGGASNSTENSSDVGSQVDESDPRGAVGAGATSRRGAPDPADSKTGQAQRGPSTAGQHAASGVESMIIGTVIGGQIAGPAGAAVGAAVFGLYGAITGDVPFETGRGRGPRRRGSADGELEREVEAGLGRQQALEAEIEEELRRQEELLESIARQEEINELLHEDEERLAGEREGDLLAAPVARPPRRIPESIFDTEYSGKGDDERIVKTLDADRDGQPEIAIRMDGKTGQLLTRSEDTNYDGTFDSTTTYDQLGNVEALAEDTNHDGVADRWTDYRDDVGERVEVDRDFDGIRDGFYTYEDGTLAYEEHDTNNDGVIDRRVEYVARRRTLELEDRDFSGIMDFKIFYDEREIPVRTELDTNEDGQTDVWEYYEGSDLPSIVLVRKEEDLDADGEIDVTSHYSDGKLVRKEIDDPSFY